MKDPRNDALLMVQEIAKQAERFLREHPYGMTEMERDELHSILCGLWAPHPVMKRGYATVATQGIGI